MRQGMRRRQPNHARSNAMSAWVPACWRGGWKRRNNFSFDVAEFRFWLNVVVGFIEQKGQRRHMANSPGRCKSSRFPLWPISPPTKLTRSSSVMMSRFDHSRFASGRCDSEDQRHRSLRHVKSLPTATPFRAQLRPPRVERIWSENRASIRMRTRRRCRNAGRAKPDRSYDSGGARSQKLWSWR